MPLHLADADAVHSQHELAFDNIVFCFYALCVLDDHFAVFSVYKIRNINALALKQPAFFHPAARADFTRLALGRDEHEFYLPTEICNLSGLL